MCLNCVTNSFFKARRFCSLRHLRIWCSQRWPLHCSQPSEERGSQSSLLSHSQTHEVRALTKLAASQSQTHEVIVLAKLAVSVFSDIQSNGARKTCCFCSLRHPRTWYSQSLSLPCTQPSEATVLAKFNAFEISDTSGNRAKKAHCFHIRRDMR